MDVVFAAGAVGGRMLLPPLMEVTLQPDHMFERLQMRTNIYFHHHVQTCPASHTISYTVGTEGSNPILYWTPKSEPVPQPEFGNRPIARRSD